MCILAGNSSILFTQPASIMTLLNGIAKIGKRVMKPISFFAKEVLIELAPTNGAKKKNKI